MHHSALGNILGQKSKLTTYIVNLMVLLLAWCHQNAFAQVTLVERSGSASAKAGAATSRFDFGLDRLVLVDTVNDRQDFDLPDLVTPTFNLTATANAVSNGVSGQSNSVLNGSFGIVDLASKKISSLSFAANSTGSGKPNGVRFDNGELTTNSFGGGSAFFEAVFAVDIDTPYQLRGQNAMAGLFFNGPGANVNSQGIGAISSSGILVPGEYRLSASTGADFELDSSSSSLNFNLNFSAVDDAIRWNKPGEGNWSEASNWDPQQLPGSNDVALFELPETYSVSVGGQTVERLKLSGGVTANGTLKNMDLVASGTSLSDPGVVADGGTFTLESGKLKNTHAVVGESIATTLNVQSGVDWTNQGRLTVGGGGEANLNIAAGAEVTSESSRIGDATNGAKGSVSINGEWDAGNIAIGNRSAGTLGINGEGFVNAEQVQIGRGGRGTVGVGLAGGSNEIAKLTATDDILVGADARGDLFVSFGDVRTDGKLVVGAGSQKGTVTASSKGGGVIAEKGFEIGSTSEGVVEVSGGASMLSLFSNEASVVGGNARGSLTVADVVDGTSSEFQVPQLVVGEFNNGVVAVKEGGVVRTTRSNVIVGKETGSSGQIVVDGESGNKASRLAVTGNLIVGGGVELPNAPADGGSGEVLVSDGGVVSIGQSLFLGGTGAGTVLVSGVSENSPSTLSVEQGLAIGHNAAGTLKVENGGEVFSIGTSSVGSYGLDGTGRIVVDGEQSSLSIIAETDDGGQVVTRGDLEVGVVAASLIDLKNGGNLSVADTLTLGEFGGIDVRDGSANIGEIDSQIGELRIGVGGELSGTGLVIGSAENDGGVNNFAGVVNPGFSPGTLTIDGNFIQGESGTTILEVGGTLAGIEYDQILVSGDAKLEGNISIDFTDGFAPREGDFFRFFDVDGTTTVIGTVPVEVLGLEDGFEFDFGVSDSGGLALVALNDGISVAGGTVPEPSSFAVWLMLVACVVAASRRTRSQTRSE